MKMREFMAVAKALADENRVRMLLALRGGELCVCQITELLGLAARGQTRPGASPRGDPLGNQSGS
jgi:DNA-binding transcriptional ArsR family regulator